MEGLPPDQQRLIYQGSVMKYEPTLADYNMQNGDIVHLVERRRCASLFVLPQQLLKKQSVASPCHREADRATNRAAQGRLRRPTSGKQRWPFLRGYAAGCTRRNRLQSRTVPGTLYVKVWIGVLAVEPQKSRHMLHMAVGAIVGLQQPDWEAGQAESRASVHVHVVCV